MILRIAAIIICFILSADAAPRLAKFQLHGPVAAGGPCGSVPCTGGVFAPLKIGPGGQITNVSIECDGGLFACNNSGTVTMVAATDTYGAWLLVSGATYWIQIDTGSPFSGKTPIFDVRIAPSDTNYMYAFEDTSLCVFGTQNKSSTWTKFAGSCVSGGYPTTKFGHVLAVDPFNKNIVYLGSPGSGLWYSTDAGTTWNQVSTATIPNGSGTVVDFDWSDATGNTLYVGNYGNGVYKCTNAAAAQGTARTCSQLSGSGMPTTMSHLLVDRQGGLYVTDNSGGGDTGKLNICVSTCLGGGGAWSQQEAANNYSGLAIDYNNCSASSTCSIVLINQGGDLDVRIAGTWTGNNSNKHRTATDVPWLGWTNENFLTFGGTAFDPSGSNKLVYGEGIGIWSTTPPTNSSNSFTYTSFGAGIEQLVSGLIISPFGGNPGVLFEDRPYFVVNQSDTSTLGYPAATTPMHGCANPQDTAIVYGYSADWIDATHIVALCYGILNATGYSGLSSDGGKNWTAFADNSTPVNGATFNVGGCMAARDTTHILWVPGNQNNGATFPYFSKDGGVTWVSVTGTQSGGWLGGTFATGGPYCAHDYVDGTVFAYNGDDGSGFDSIWSCPGSADCTVGANWTRVCHKCKNGSANFFANPTAGVVLHAIYARHNTLLISGPSTNAGPNPFYMSTDGGATWTQPDTNIFNVFGWGQGKACNGADFSVLLFGQKDPGGVFGSYRGDFTSGVPTWTALPGYHNNDNPNTVGGDMNTCGTEYIGFAGSGFQYYTVN